MKPILFVAAVLLINLALAVDNKVASPPADKNQTTPATPIPQNTPSNRQVMCNGGPASFLIPLVLVMACLFPVY